MEVGCLGTTLAGSECGLRLLSVGPGTSSFDSLCPRREWSTGREGGPGGSTGEQGQLRGQVTLIPPELGFEVQEDQIVFLYGDRKGHPSLHMAGELFKRRSVPFQS